MEELLELLEMFVLVRGTAWSAEFAQFVEGAPFLGYLMLAEKALNVLGLGFWNPDLWWMRSYISGFFT